MKTKLIDRFSGPDGHENVINALSAQSAFQNNQQIVEEIAAKGKLLSFEEGESLIFTGGMERDVFFILAGETTVHVNGTIVARRSAGTHVGEMAMVDPAAIRSATVTAVSETVAVEVSQQVFTEIADRHGFLWKAIAKEVANRLRQRNSLIKPGKKLVILIHGIRTQAEWQSRLHDILTDEDTVVMPIKYGFFDAFQFWWPLGTRIKPILEVHRKVAHAIQQNPGHQVIVIAHSFGTYAISKIIKANPLIEISRMILCGAIIPSNFRWAEIPNRPNLIVNDCGSDDIWPVLAATASWGYGKSGAFGFGTPEVRDRFSKNTHSSFFGREFVEQHWKPFVESGIISQIGYEQTTASYWKSILHLIPIKWLFLAGIIFFIWKAFGR
jgi:pimeloyl-ACP methyl ester carboxylesterase